MINRKLAELGIGLPEPRSPAFDYLPVVLHGHVAYISGQLPWRSGNELITGKLGAEVSLELGAEAARCCVLHGLSVLKAALGDFNRLDRIIKLTGFVASAPGFVDQPRVIDAASGLLTQLLGENGRHARSAIGVAELPRGAAVEIELIVGIRDQAR
jgi:enamine deaminase RidA (YjgF/YER057c/UK114 family)